MVAPPSSPVGTEGKRDHRGGGKHSGQGKNKQASGRGKGAVMDAVVLPRCAIGACNYLQAGRQWCVECKPLGAAPPTHASARLHQGVQCLEGAQSLVSYALCTANMRTRMVSRDATSLMAATEGADATAAARRTAVQR